MSLPASVLDTPFVDVRKDDGVPVIVLPDEPVFDALRDHLRQRMPALLPAIGGRASRLDLGGRAIDLFELRRLLHLLKDDFGVAITALYVRPQAITRFAERELKLKLFPVPEPEIEPEIEPEDDTEPVDEIETETEDEIELEPEDPTEDETGPDPDPAPTVEHAARVAPAPSEDDDSGGVRGRRTLTVERTLRSGHSVRFEGDIIVMGDVNPGAQVIASGNVMIFGALKGLAHAGATGDDEAFILAFDLRPTQLRIARKIAIPPERAADARVETEVARIVGDHVVIQPYQIGRTRSPR